MVKNVTSVKNSEKKVAVKASSSSSAKSKSSPKTKSSAKTTKSPKAPKSDELDIIAEAIIDKKGQNVISLDLREIGGAISDFFVICNADSTTNVASIADNIEEELLKKANRKVLRSQGKENCFWIIEDYGNIVVHIFQTQYRDFYRLEELWSDCKIKHYKD